MPSSFKNIKRGFRKITGRQKTQHDIPPAAAAASSTPEEPSATDRQHVQEKSRDNVPATSPISPAAASSSITLEEPSATSTQHVQEHPRDSSISTPPTNHQQSDAAQSLWDRAYNALAEANPDLVKQYDELLEKEQMANSAPNETISSKLSAPHGLDTRPDRSSRQIQLNTVIQAGLQRMKDNKTTLNIAGHEIVLADQITKAAKFLLWGKDWIDTAVKASPEASLVWSGVCLVLPLLTNPTTASEANKDGFSYVTSRLRYYVALEPMLRQLGRNASVSEALIIEANGHLVDLYQDILDFQLSSVLRFYGSRFKVYVHDTVASKDWEKTLFDIKTREQTVNSDFDQINNLAAGLELVRLNKTSEDMCATMEDCLSVAMQHLDVSKKQLVAQEDAQQERLLDKQHKCLQLFCLARNGNDAMYDWYKGRVELRVEGTCRWFLQHENFQKWLLQESGPLLVSADPGCGKSVLAKYLIDEGLAQQSATICYFFFKDQDQNTIRQALCALLHQLFSQKSALIQHAMKLYNKMEAALVKSEPSLWTILRDAVHDPQAGPVIFVIDALDECAESELSNLITGLETLLSAKFKVLMTSRPYEQVVSEFYSLQDASRRIHIPGEEEFETISQEINSVIQHLVDQLARKHRLSDTIKSTLARKLLTIEHRTYLWVYLVFDYLEKKQFKRTDGGIDAAIQTLPTTVNQAYDQMLNRSHEDETVTVKKVLSIVLAARRPLTLSEMNIAINLDGPGRGRSIYDLDLEEDADFKSRLRNLCGLFVNVHHDKVYFLHQTAREFLIQSSAPTTVSSDLQWHHSITTRHAHSVLAEICMFYLDMLNSTHTEKFRQDDQHDALVQYSVKHWGDHCREAGFEKGSVMEDLALRLCTPDLTSRSQWASIIFEKYYILPGSGTNVLVASHLGLTTVTELLLSRGADVDAKNSHGVTALIVAANSGHEAVARLLLKNRADVDAKTNYGLTALITAARNDRETVARLLLDCGADIEARNDDGWTALIFAATYGHDAVTRLLLENRANIEARDCNGVTALIAAARYDHETVAQLLLDSGADIEARDNDGWTALIFAADAGCETVARLLLENSANVEARDDNGWMALLATARHGHETVAQLLLDSGADIEARDGDGVTALIVAANSGHEAVARLLLENSANVEARDNDGWTALVFAADAGCETVARLLLENSADIEARDGDGVTALIVAAKSGHEAIARLLLDSGADVDAKNSHGETALIVAANSGHEAVARLLLKNLADVDAKTNHGVTALIAAARHDHETVAQLLLDSGADIEAKDNKGWTAFTYADKSGHEPVKRLLFDHGAQVEAKDVEG